MKRILRILIFTAVILLVGRNLSFLPAFPIANRSEKNTAELKQKVLEYIGDKPGSYSVLYWNFQTGEQFDVNEKTIIVGASLNKVPVIAVLYHLADKGEINLDESVTIQPQDIQDFGTGSIRYEGAGGTYSLRTLARLSFEHSDNTAAYVLGNKIGMDRVQEIANGWGLSQLDMQNNKISARDLGILFQKIYKGEIIQADLRDELIGFMDDSLFEDRIPKLLPKDVKVYHKIGDEVGNIHDVGIVEYNDKAYFLAVLTYDQKDQEKVKQSIAEISKIVFDSQKD